MGGLRGPCRQVAAKVPSCSDMFAYVRVLGKTAIYAALCPAFARSATAGRARSRYGQARPPSGKVHSPFIAFLWGQGGTAKAILMTDKKTETTTGNSNGAFRFFPLFLGFSRFSGKGTLGGGRPPIERDGSRVCSPPAKPGREFSAYLRVFAGLGKNRDVAIQTPFRLRQRACCPNPRRGKEVERRSCRHLKIEAESRVRPLLRVTDPRSGVWATGTKASARKERVDTVRKSNATGLP